MGSNTTGALVSRVVEELDRLPAQPLVAVQAIRLMGNPNTSAADLGRLVEVDPALTARVLRLANSPYYGMSGKVRHPANAVVLLGVKTVHAMVAAASHGLLDGEDDYGDGWVHALSVGTACRVLAKVVRASEPEAFTAGLLHDIGSTLLERVDPEGYERVTARVAAGEHRVAAERAELGTDHGEAGAAALEAWRFPPTIVRAVGHHHGTAERRVDTWAKLLVAGEALAEQIEPGLGDADADLDESLAHLGVRTEDASRLVSDAARDLDQLLGAITKGARP